MAEQKRKKNNKGPIIGACVAVVAVIIVIIAVVAINNNRLGDSYFVSDGTKYVLSYEIDQNAVGNSDEAQYTPLKVHQVYTYSGDDITGLKNYYEYKDADSAKKAMDYLNSVSEGKVTISMEGKYVIITATADQYEGLKASDVKQQVEALEKLKAEAQNNNNSSNNTTENNSGTVESGTTTEIKETN